MGKYCYVASARRARGLGAHGVGEGRGILCHHVHSLLFLKINIKLIKYHRYFLGLRFNTDAVFVLNQSMPKTTIKYCCCVV